MRRTPEIITDSIEDAFDEFAAGLTTLTLTKNIQVHVRELLAQRFAVAFARAGYDIEKIKLLNDLWKSIIEEDKNNGV